MNIIRRVWKNMWKVGKKNNSEQIPHISGIIFFFRSRFWLLRHTRHDRECEWNDEDNIWENVERNETRKIVNHQREKNCFFFFFIFSFHFTSSPSLYEIAGFAGCVVDDDKMLEVIFLFWLNNFSCSCCWSLVTVLPAVLRLMWERLHTKRAMNHENSRNALEEAENVFYFTHGTNDIWNSMTLNLSKFSQSAQLSHEISEKRNTSSMGTGKIYECKNLSHNEKSQKSRIFSAISCVIDARCSHQTSMFPMSSILTHQEFKLRMTKILMFR